MNAGTAFSIGCLFGSIYATLIWRIADRFMRRRSGNGEATR